MLEVIRSGSDSWQRVPHLSTPKGLSIEPKQSPTTHPYDTGSVPKECLFPRRAIAPWTNQSMHPILLQLQHIRTSVVCFMGTSFLA